MVSCQFTVIYSPTPDRQIWLHRDLFCLMGTPLESSTLKWIATRLREDKYQMESNNNISFLAKWVPSEGSALDRRHHITGKLCKRLKVNRKELRTEYLTPLRSKLDLIETMMCSDSWQDIEINRVPKIALKRYTSILEARLDITCTFSLLFLPLPLPLPLPSRPTLPPKSPLRRPTECLPLYI